MAFDGVAINHPTLASERVFSLESIAIAKLGETEGKAFMDRKYVIAGNETPRQMAHRSQSGYTTAKHMLFPSGGC
ncbi:MAG: hypothetical protein CMH30_07095 [Micavibrio sp.]|nr:hypothetical protein [Micavibrio sp.]|tara:strand:+ start:1753 stop:1977 length:225 start_codon:yes stop_codon:yes gene_type:complete